MVGNNSEEFSTNFIQTGEKEYKRKRSLLCRKGRKEIGTTQCYQGYLLKGKVSPEGGRVCANCEGVSSGEGNGVSSLLMSGLKDECFTCSQTVSV